MDIALVRTDLLQEQAALDRVVSDLDDDRWATPTASEGWDVADQIGHLAFFDEMAAIAITDPERFAALRDEQLVSFAEAAGSDDDPALRSYRAMTPAELLSAWRAKRDQLAEAGATLADDDRIAWYGPSMGSKSFLTARLMEVWAHGQDIIDAVDGSRPATDRLRHIAQLGFITRGWSYVNRGKEIPATPVRVELRAPSGDTWAFGPDDAADSVVGTAEDFCLVVTQRRHVADTGLEVSGDGAREWMEIAQAFAGPPTDGPAAGARS